MPQVYIEKQDKTVEVKETLVSDILKSLEINSTTVIITKNHELILEDTILDAKDKISIIPVISGG